MTPPKIYYKTTCKMPGCQQQFERAPLDIPALGGEPSPALLKFVGAMLEHVGQVHPKEYEALLHSSQTFFAFLCLKMFHFEDPRLQQEIDWNRRAFRRTTESIVISDDEIEERLEPLDLDPDLHEGLLSLIGDLRDLLTDRGQYSAESIQQTEKRIITP